PGLGEMFMGDMKPAGLNDLKAEGHPLPPVKPVFHSFHWMVVIGIVILGLFGAAAALLPGGRLYKSTWLLKLLVPAVVLPHIANNLGWMTAEIGRQPWTVYRLQTTTQGVSPNVSAGQVLGSLIMFVLLYTLLGALYVFVLDRRIKAGPVFDHDDGEEALLKKPVEGKF
ncbi:MAG: cytochrome ubiquinol oxidase subunit I, partial [Fimbriimonadaceae bacterium]|nr:cytochrome ubiquinol oxidase subunit I [Fimbriimonadaceae bacterium]